MECRDGGEEGSSVRVARMDFIREEEDASMMGGAVIAIVGYFDRNDSWRN